MSDALNHAELSRELALALGYAPESVRVVRPWPPEPVRNYCEVYRITNDMGPYWRKFDYRDPTIVLPLIKWLGSEYRMFFWYCSPTSLAGPRWSCSGRGIVAPALEEAVARAVIAVRKG